MGRPETDPPAGASSDGLILTGLFALRSIRLATMDLGQAGGNLRLARPALTVGHLGIYRTIHSKGPDGRTDIPTSEECVCVVGTPRFAPLAELAGTRHIDHNAGRRVTVI